MLLRIRGKGIFVSCYYVQFIQNFQVSQCRTLCAFDDFDTTRSRRLAHPWAARLRQQWGEASRKATSSREHAGFYFNFIPFELSFPGSAGHDLNTLRQYLETSRQSYTMQGLRIRIEQDASQFYLYFLSFKGLNFCNSAFEKTLMDTKEALLVVCDPSDKELGVGMDEKQFIDWMQRERVLFRFDLI